MFVRICLWGRSRGRFAIQWAGARPVLPPFRNIKGHGAGAQCRKKRPGVCEASLPQRAGADGIVAGARRGFRQSLGHNHARTCRPSQRTKAGQGASRKGGGFPKGTWPHSIGRGLDSRKLAERPSAVLPCGCKALDSALLLQLRGIGENRLRKMRGDGFYALQKPEMHRWPYPRPSRQCPESRNGPQGAEKMPGMQGTGKPRMPRLPGRKGTSVQEMQRGRLCASMPQLPWNRA